MELSENVAIAVICWVAALASVLLAGVTATAVTTAAVTVTLVVPEMLLMAAVMVALPSATGVTTPLAETVAMAVFEDDQVTELVMV